MTSNLEPSRYVVVVYEPLRAPEIEALFPGQGVLAFATDRLLPDAPLFPEESDFIQNAVEGRRSEFATGRA